MSSQALPHPLDGALYKGSLLRTRADDSIRIPKCSPIAAYINMLTVTTYLRSRGYTKDLGITMCHLSSVTGSPVTLRLGTIGRPSSCVLGRAGNIIVLAQRQDEPLWHRRMDIFLTGNGDLLQQLSGKLKTTPVPKGSWGPPRTQNPAGFPPKNKFLVFGDSLFSKTIPADEVCRQVQTTTSPVAAGKALSEMYSALTNGKRECIAVIMFKSDANQPVEEEVEKYRCWEFMLKNHKMFPKRRAKI
ncbi:uncharacterized protein TNIN_243071 [Trichonephila inaurata madagascariensis]|uniref:Uncharacterized protein n=1 Tax=Trichonephila inaurata madagascariensis TaxID=2747483 RepID=A0A8X7C6D5_9ARAC|nr:uncharacterized protein TNIN_243071 [Trichonephila inaurata madagascariensis]